MYFYFLGFRCCYCNFLNRARKQKPSAPKLMYNVGHNSPSLNTSEYLSPDTNTEHLKDRQTESISASDSGLKRELLSIYLVIKKTIEINSKQNF